MQNVLGLYDSGVKKERPLILDCGCGKGTYAYKLSAKYMGLDKDFSSIKLAHNIHPCDMFVVGDATKLPFENLVYDCAICSEVLEHISDDKAVLVELARVIKVKGRLIVSVPNIECKSVFVNWQRSLIDTEVGHQRRGYSISCIAKLIVDSGFKIQKNRYGCGPLTAVVECCMIKLGGIFEYKPSNLGNLFEKKKPLLVKLALKIYKLLFPFIISFTYLDKLLPRRYKSNIVIMAEKQSFRGQA